MKVLALGDAHVATGFSRVTRSVLQVLAERHEIHQIGVNYRGQPHELNWPVTATSDTDRLGESQLPEMVSTLRPDILWAVGDLWMQIRWMERLQSCKHRPKIILYMPIESGPLPPNAVSQICGADVIVVYTAYAMRVLTCAMNRVEGVRVPRVMVLAHGVDQEIFYPLSGTFEPTPLNASRSQARKLLFGPDHDLEDAFIVLNGNRNILRKRVDITVRGFALFAQQKPENVQLHLHMGITDEGWDIVKLADRHGINDRLILTSMASSLPSVETAQLNAIYNAASVGLNTSVAEGWGLVNFEHAATGAPQIGPRHSGFGEIWKDSAVLLEPATTVTAVDGWADEYLVTAEALADALERLYSNAGLYEQMAEAAYRNATRPDYAWSRIGREWEALFLAEL